MDEKTRKLERIVEQETVDGKATPSDARFELTKQYLRSKRGTVAWFREKPHGSAVRCDLVFQTENYGQSKETSTSGWCIAVASIQDALNLTSAALYCTFFELETGKWFKVQGRRSSFDSYALKLQEKITTEDAFGRTRDTIKKAGWKSWFGPKPDEMDSIPNHYGGGIQVIPIPSVGPIAGRPRDEPLYDSEIVDVIGGSSMLYLFQNFNTFTHPVYDGPGAISTKLHGVHTNLVGHGGSLPQACCAEITGLSLEVFSLDGKSLPPEMVACIGANSSVAFSFTTSRLFSIPTSMCLAGGGTEEEGEGFKISAQPPPIYPLGFTIKLNPLETFRIELTTHLLRNKWQKEWPDKFMVRAVLHGFIIRGITG